MERAEIRVARAAGLGAGDGLPLTLADVVVTLMATLAATYLVVAGRWVPGVWPAVATFAVIALGPPLLRALARKFPRHRALELAASFWLLPSAVVAHAQLGPIVDAFRPTLLDSYLALADLKLFGQHPGMLLERFTPPALMDLLLVCYYGYFIWPFAFGVLLYSTRERRTFDEYVLALALLFAANFVLYTLVPAIGPRYYLAGQFEGPLQGLVLTPLLDSAMRLPGFSRDCFPSGHTATTLLVLGYAYRHHRRFFWTMLVPATGLIAATVIGRFHYVVDLICAVPLMAACFVLATALARARPRGVVVVARPAFEVRSPV